MMINKMFNAQCSTLNDEQCSMGNDYNIGEAVPSLSAKNALSINMVRVERCFIERCFFAMILIFAAIAAVPLSAQPLTLDQCVAMALKSNLNIEVAGEKVNEMDAAVSEAFTNNLPKLSASASYTRLLPVPSATVPAMADLNQIIDAIRGDALNLIPQGGAFAPIKSIDFTAPGHMGNVFGAGLSLTQVLYTAGKVKNASKIAEHSREATAWQLMSAVREVRRDVTKAYYTALAANRSIIALDSAISLMTVMVRDLGNAVDVGMRGEHELLQAQVQLANQRLARQQAATGAQAAHNYLSTLIGVPVNTPITLVEDMEAPETFDAPDVPSMQTQAREASTDIKALRKQLEIIETSLLITNAANLPTVLANASYNGQGIGWFGKEKNKMTGESKSKFTWDNSGTLSLIMQWDIYNGGAANHKRAQTLSQKRQLELMIENINVNMDMVVKNNCASLEDAYTSLEIGRESIDQTKKSYDIQYDKFQVGLLLSSELLNSQNLCLQAEISYYAALSTFYSRLADLNYLISAE